MTENQWSIAKCAAHIESVRVGANVMLWLIANSTKPTEGRSLPPDCESDRSRRERDEHPRRQRAERRRGATCCDVVSRVAEDGAENGRC